MNFCSIYNDDLCTSKPVISIKIAGVTGVGLVDSGAQTNLAGSTLYEILKKTNHNFMEAKLNLVFADGRPHKNCVLQIETEVWIQGRVIKTTFLVLPGVENNHTLPGIPFLEEAKIVLNTPEKQWVFADQIDNKFDFIREDRVHCKQLFEVVKNTLREDEGEDLNNSDRQKLSRLLNCD